tara:strand:+ start:1040 stop:1789 length:750 start_codon:yes stop_codon:yes gene_type:complete
MRILLIIFSLIYPYYLYSKEINLQFEIDWNSIHLADVYWNISINDKAYKVNFLIKSYGVTDKIYNYESLTYIEGIVDNNFLRPIKYQNKTKSSRQDIYNNFDFSLDGKILNYKISKKLSLGQKNMYEDLLDKHQYFTDPISQLVQYFLFKKDSDRLIYDGLNIYELSKEDMSQIDFSENNPTIHKGVTNHTKLIFPFFHGLHKKEKKNNLKEIHMYFTTIQNINIPVQYDVLSKKFNAKLYLKNVEIKD